MAYQTKNRQKIIEYLKLKKDSTVSISDIYDYLHNAGDNINVTTIYRFLDKLEADGRIMKYQDNNCDKAVYRYIDENQKCNEHLHLQCINCGKIIHLDCEFMKQINSHILKHHNFIIQYSKSILYGTCEKCNSEINNI